MQINMRWLGVAGYDMEVSGKHILIDPYVTRFPYWRFMFGRVQPDPGLVDKYFHAGEAIFISHAHIDHVLDAPEIAKKFQIPIYGSGNTLQIARLHGLDESLLNLIKPGDEFKLGDFCVTVHAGKHLPMPFFLPGKLPPKTITRMTARDYRMDDCFCFEMRIKDYTILTDPGIGSPDIEKVDVLFINPLLPEKTIVKQVSRYSPRVLIPNHWDDFSASLEKPILPQVHPTLRRLPSLRFDLNKFTRLVINTLPGVNVISLPRLKLVSFDLEKGSLVKISS